MRKIWVLGLDWISFHIVEPHLKYLEPPTRARADWWRKIARIFHTDNFPEIFSDLEICPRCEQATLLLVHPDMICDSCWIAEMRLVKEYGLEGVRALKAGAALEEVNARLDERLANDPRTVAPPSQWGQVRSIKMCGDAGLRAICEPFFPLR